MREADPILTAFGGEETVVFASEKPRKVLTALVVTRLPPNEYGQVFFEASLHTIRTQHHAMPAGSTVSFTPSERSLIVSGGWWLSADKAKTRLLEQMVDRWPVETVLRLLDARVLHCEGP